MPVVAVYPAAIPAFTPKVDDVDTVWADHVNTLQAEVAAIASTIGTSPAATYGTVKARIAAAEALINTVAGRFDSGGLLPEAGVNGLNASLAALSAQIAAITTFPMGAWTTFTPAVRVGGTAYTFAAGVSKGAYLLVGKTLFFNISVTAAPTGGGGSSGQISVDLPGGVTTVNRRQSVSALVGMVAPPTNFASLYEGNQMILESATTIFEFNIVGNDTQTSILDASNGLNLLIVNGVIEVA